jgi:hypothetical protein
MQRRCRQRSVNKWSHCRHERAGKHAWRSGVCDHYLMLSSDGAACSSGWHADLTDDYYCLRVNTVALLASSFINDRNFCSLCFVV